MSLFLKTVAAFAVGIGLMAGVQHAYVWSVAGYVRSEAARNSAALPDMKPLKFDNAKVGDMMKAMHPKPIDTSEGQRLAIQSRAHQIYLQNRAAQNAVPLPRR